LTLLSRHDRNHLPLWRRERPGHFVVQQLGAFAQRVSGSSARATRGAGSGSSGSRIHQPAPQPVEPPAEVAQVLGAAHRDRPREIRAASWAIAASISAIGREM